VLEQAGADGLELNVACPISLVGYEATDPAVKLIEEVNTLEMRTLRKLGLTPSMGEIPEVLAPITKACVDAVKIPVGVKPRLKRAFPSVSLWLNSLPMRSQMGNQYHFTDKCRPSEDYENGKTPWNIVHFPINPSLEFQGQTTGIIAIRIL